MMLFTTILTVKESSGACRRYDGRYEAVWRYNSECQLSFFKKNDVYGASVDMTINNNIIAYQLLESSGMF